MKNGLLVSKYASRDEIESNFIKLPHNELVMIYCNTLPGGVYEWEKDIRGWLPKEKCKIFYSGGIRLSK